MKCLFIQFHNSNAFIFKTPIELKEKFYIFYKSKLIVIFKHF